ncbi:hypothetical protein GN956_G24849 [Arapaima gigas]
MDAAAALQRATFLRLSEREKPAIWVLEPATWDLRTGLAAARSLVEQQRETRADDAQCPNPASSALRGAKEDKNRRAKEAMCARL